MTFVSYAQNFEDVLLWRALKDIKHGFYIDIGAQDPIVDSVSLAFYQHGWRGVHVEPTPQYAERLKEQRPDETVERLAIGSSEGSLTFFQIPDTGLSTADAEIANRHRAAGRSVIETQVEVLGLDGLLDRYDYKIVHWLKIDVEGFEKQVLESWKSSPVRPWILLIESTAPGTQTQTHQVWEPLILEKGYRYAYFDGLNRYYVHEKRSELLDHFQLPVSIFDEFFLSGTASQPYCDLLKGQLQDLGVERDLLRSQSEQQGADLLEARARIETLALEVPALDARALAAEAAKADLLKVTAQVTSDLEQSEQEKALLTERLNESLSNAHHWWLRAVDAQVQVEAIHASSSWRLTRPWRFLGRQRHQMGAGFLRGSLTARSSAKAILRKPLTCGLAWLSRHPRLLEMLSSGLRKAPFLHGVTRKLYRRFVASPASPAQAPRPCDIDNTPPDQDELTRGARHVLAQLDARQGSNIKDVG
ncbi:FkbM family methyltransferase [Pseudomonas oryzihabitans]|uniref:FkbM family methyltransferase n=1 Tax=Pseudomonas oryzihabitans TaxID=47885 RepID=UPI001120B44F|nr:FkbM family methyltransferase [Pseudomonas psychrotolerans]QDD90374.1 hypothetical protein CCZ28_15655 [Pseudomonas psychrotolerans]